MDYELDVVKGNTTIRPLDRVYLSLDSEGYHAGPDKCGGVWYVDGFEGGNMEVGIISRCGVYWASPWPRPRPYKVTVEATKYGLDGCADCCPYGAKTIKVVD
jgi:hypothetical protein